MEFEMNKVFFCVAQITAMSCRERERERDWERVSDNK